MGSERSLAELNDLIRELQSNRGVPAMVAATSILGPALIDWLADRLAHVVSLGERVSAMQQAPTVDDLLGDLTATSTLLLDIDVLFTPALQVDVVQQLRHIAQRTALIVAWPGRVAGGRLTYSLPGRADHVDEPARGVFVLRPVDTEFPDEVPYTLERFPA